MKQVGGSHYENMAIQPIEIIKANGLNYFEGNALKYLLRYKVKGNPLEDLRKLRSYVDEMIEQEEKLIEKEKQNCIESVDPVTPAFESNAIAFPASLKEVYNQVVDNEAELKTVFDAGQEAVSAMEDSISKIAADRKEPPKVLPIVTEMNKLATIPPISISPEFDTYVERVLNEDASKVEEEVGFWSASVPLVKAMIIKMLEKYGVKTY